MLSVVIVSVCAVQCVLDLRQLLALALAMALLKRMPCISDLPEAFPNVVAKASEGYSRCNLHADPEYPSDSQETVAPTTLEESAPLTVQTLCPDICDTYQDTQVDFSEWTPRKEQHEHSQEHTQLNTPLSSSISLTPSSTTTASSLSPDFEDFAKGFQEKTGQNRQAALALWFLDSCGSLPLEDDNSDRSRSPVPLKERHDQAIREAKQRDEQHPSITWLVSSMCPHAFVLSLMESKQFAKLYIGITQDPEWRWFSSGHRETESGNWIQPHCVWWFRMYVLDAFMGDQAGELERALIAECKGLDPDNSKVENILKGGEQAKADKLTYVYVLANTANECAEIATKRKMWWRPA